MPPSKRRAPSNGTVSDYRLLQKHIGTTRSVVVQPRNYAVDNEVPIDALRQLAPNARGVAVVHPSITDAELERFDEATRNRILVANPEALYGFPVES